VIAWNCTIYKIEIVLEIQWRGYHRQFKWRIYDLQTVKGLILLFVYFSTSMFGWFMVLNATFNNISVISWQSLLLVEGTGVPGENHRPVTTHWQTLYLSKSNHYNNSLYQFDILLIYFFNIYCFSLSNRKKTNEKEMLAMNKIEVSHIRHFNIIINNNNWIIKKHVSIIAYKSGCSSLYIPTVNWNHTIFFFKIYFFHCSEICTMTSHWNRHLLNARREKKTLVCVKTTFNIRRYKQ
jgi:hypothetical protein